MELREAILQRKSIRGFLDKPVARDTLEEVLKLAQRAVSGKNSQPWLVQGGIPWRNLKDSSHWR